MRRHEIEFKITSDSILSIKQAQALGFGRSRGVPRRSGTRSGSRAGRLGALRGYSASSVIRQGGSLGGSCEVHSVRCTSPLRAASVQ